MCPHCGETERRLFTGSRLYCLRCGGVIEALGAETQAPSSRLLEAVRRRSRSFPQDPRITLDDEDDFVLARAQAADDSLDEQHLFEDDDFAFSLLVEHEDKKELSKSLEDGETASVMTADEAATSPTPLTMPVFERVPAFTPPLIMPEDGVEVDLVYPGPRAVYVPPTDTSGTTPILNSAETGEASHLGAFSGFTAAVEAENFSMESLDASQSHSSQSEGPPTGNLSTTGPEMVADLDDLSARLPLEKEQPPQSTTTPTPSVSQSFLSTHLGHTLLSRSLPPSREMTLSAFLSIRCIFPLRTSPCDCCAPRLIRRSRLPTQPQPLPIDG